MKILTLTLCLFLAITAFGQSTPCSTFKTGEFKYSNPKYSEWTIKRNDSIQVEISSKTGIEIYSLIQWKSDCKYLLTCNNVLNTNNQKNIIGRTFTVTIKDTYPNRYKCLSKSTNTQKNSKLELEMIKIK